MQSGEIGTDEKVIDIQEGRGRADSVLHMCGERVEIARVCPDSVGGRVSFGREVLEELRPGSFEG